MQIRCDVSLGGMLIDRTYRNIGFRLPYSCIQKIIFDKDSLLCNTTHILPIYIIAYVMTSYNKIQFSQKAAKPNCNCNMSHLGNCQNHLGDACHTSRTWQIIPKCRCKKLPGFLDILGRCKMRIRMNPQNILVPNSWMIHSSMHLKSGSILLKDLTLSLGVAGKCEGHW